MKPYAIANWDEYENNRSRTVKDLQWVKVPNRHDGEGYSIVMAHERAAELFSAWILMLQVASRCSPRGTLIRDNGKPHDASSLEIKTRGKKEWFSLAFSVLSSPDVGWLTLPTSPDCQAGDAQVTPKCPRGDAVVPKKGREGNGTEGREGEGIAPAGECSEIPTAEEAIAMTMTLGCPESFARFVYDDWASRSGKDAGGVTVRFLPYVTKRWVREQNEWRSKTHKGNKISKPSSFNASESERIAKSIEAAEVSAARKEKQESPIKLDWLIKKVNQ